MGFEPPVRKGDPAIGVKVVVSNMETSPVPLFVIYTRVPAGLIAIPIEVVPLVKKGDPIIGAKVVISSTERSLLPSLAVYTKSAKACLEEAVRKTRSREVA